jgi:uncharacterized surface protein with fasciclin (FAS1) repeats
MAKLLSKSLTITFALSIGALMFSACSDHNGSNPKNKMNVAEIVQNQESLSSLNGLLSKHELSDTLSQGGPVTLFAPDNNALSNTSLSDSTDLAAKSVLEYHIVASNLTYKNLKKQDSVSYVTLNGDSLYFTAKGDSIFINGGQAVITKKGATATNGTIFTIGSVLTMPSK